MLDNKSHIFKGAAPFLCGLLIAFVPNIISNLFYLIGLAILILCALRFINAMKNDTLHSELTSCIMGVLVGLAVIALPRFVKVQIPLIFGVIFAVVGLSRLLRTLRNDYTGKKMMSLAGAVILLLAGVFFMINPLKISGAVRIIFGLAVAAMGVFNLYVAYTMKKHNDNVEPTVVDVDSFSVRDDQ